MWITLIIISIICSIIAGMGIGGGSIFIMLSTILNIFNQKEAAAYNLVMFIIVGIMASMVNIKNKKIDKNLFFKLIIFVIIGSFVGIYLAGILNEKSLKLYFNIFMLIIGIYEIISCLKNDKKQTI